MNLYSEIYGAYYNIIADLLRMGSFSQPELMLYTDKEEKPSERILQTVSPLTPRILMLSPEGLRLPVTM